MIYIVMKRTQLYLDDDMAKVLATVSRQRGTTVSELVRECVRDKFAERQPIDRASLVRQVAGVWKHRRDLGATETYVRTLRHDTRRRRLKIGENPS
jgi:hypothetical protein